MMKKTLSVLALSALPVLALAGGDHQGGHGMAGHDMQGMHGMHGSMHGGASHSNVGKPGDPAKVDRTIEVVMDDSMRFTPATTSMHRSYSPWMVVSNGPT